MTKSLRILKIFALIGACLPSVSMAQDSTKRVPWLGVLSVGFPHMAPMLFTIGGNFTRLRPGALSPDFSIGTIPFALVGGVMNVGARAGLALPMQFSTGGVFLPSAGFSTFAAMGAGVFGTNVGLALATKKGTRAGLTWHRFPDSDLGVVLLEIGVGRIK